MRLPYDTRVFIPDTAASVRGLLFPNKSRTAFQGGVMVVREQVAGLKIHPLVYLSLCE